LVAVPDKVPVIIFAVKLPLASLATMAFAVLAAVAVVALLLTFKAVLIVANLVSEILPAKSLFVTEDAKFNLEYAIDAELEISAFTIVASTILADVTTLSETDDPFTLVNPEPSPTNALAVIVPEIVALEAERPELSVKDVPVAAPKIGVTKVGLFESTKLPLPVEVVVPVPPLATAIVVPLQTPDVMVPTVVKLEETTVDFNVVPDKVPASAIIEVVPAAVKRPLLSTVKVGMAVEDP
jgi:hypothetical protein